MVLKKLLARKIENADPNIPRLILMSATFNTSLFAAYFHFKTPLQKKPPRAIFVGAQRYPTQIYYFESLLHSPVLAAMKEILPPPPIMFSKFSAKVSMQHEQIDAILWILSVLALTHRNDIDAGSVALVFLPGLEDIERLLTFLKECEQTLLANFEFGNESAPLFELIMLHSMLEDEIQDTVFTAPKPGQLRVVLSTNIAESSVTLPNVKYVLDVGLAKQIDYAPEFVCDTLVPVFTSQASARQRAGRCGRVCPGTVFRLYSKQHHDTCMPLYEKPELLRASLSMVWYFFVLDHQAKHFFWNRCFCRSKHQQPWRSTKLGQTL